MSRAGMWDRLDRVTVETRATPISAPRQAAVAGTGPDKDDETGGDDPEDTRENFIAVTPQALIDRLSDPSAWPPEEVVKVRRLYLYLSNWRQQSYGARLLELSRLYEPFSPDSDLLVTRTYSTADRLSLGHRLVDGVRYLLKHANFTRIDPSNIELILTKESHYGLDLHVDLEAFDVLEIHYRGISTRRDSKRTLGKLYLAKEEFDVPIFQRLAIVFKLKSAPRRAAELAARDGIDLAQAERRVKRLRGPIADQIKSDFVYIKMFKNIPRADMEMVFPNTRIKFRLLDKIRLGVTASGGLGVGVAGTMSKLAVASNPIALAGAVAGLGGVAIRQLVNFSNQRNKYMVTMAQNLYAHTLADNRGAMALLAERASEEDFKEEILLYTLLAKERVKEAELKSADLAIERYLASTFGLDVNFDVTEALGRLQQDGLVRTDAEGTLVALQPGPAAERIDALWDNYLNQLVEFAESEGREYDGETPATLP